MTFFSKKRHIWSSASVRLAEHEKSSCHLQAGVQWFEAEQRLTKDSSLDSINRVLSFAAPRNFHCVWLFASANR